MVAGTAVLLVVATVDLVNGDDPAPPGDTAQQVVATPQATPSDEAVGDGATDGADGTGKAGKKRKKKKADEPVVPAYTPPPAPPPAEPDGPCDDADVVVTPVMGPVVAGRPVLVTLELRTVEDEACTWTVNREHLAYKITDGDDDVWSSSHCPRQVPEDDVVVRRDLTTTYRIAWSGRLSSRDCPVSMDYAPPGDYAVQAAAIGGEPSEVVPFTLTDPADVAPVEPAGPPVPETSTGTKGKKKDKGDGKNKGKKNRDRQTAASGG